MKPSKEIHKIDKRLKKSKVKKMKKLTENNGKAFSVANDDKQISLKNNTKLINDESNVKTEDIQINVIKKRKRNDLNDSVASSVGFKRKKKRQFSGNKNNERIEQSIDVKDDKPIHKVADNDDDHQQHDNDDGDVKNDDENVKMDFDSSEKTKVNKELINHKEKKMRTKMRKMKENKNYDLFLNAKNICNEMIRNDCSKERRNECLNELIEMIGGNVNAFINAHDNVRIIQSIVKLGNDDHRSVIFKEINGILIELTKGKYSKFLIRKMLKYGSKGLKQNIIKSYYGNVKALMRNVNSAQILEIVYSEIANGKEKYNLIQEYYDTEYFKNIPYKKLAQNQKQIVLSKMKEEIITVIDKIGTNHSLIQYLLRQYFHDADDNEKHDLAHQLIDKVIDILHTKDGSRVAMECVWNSNAKDRKTIIKSLKPNIAKIAKDEYGYSVLLAIFDSVDDTVLIEKNIINEIASHLDIATDRYGVKVLEYLISPRDTKCFHPNFLNVLMSGDNNIHSKKDRDVRQKELRSIVSPLMLKLIESNAKELLLHSNSCLLILNILFNSAIDCDPLPALNAIVKVLENEGPYFDGNDDNLHIIERGNSNFVIKKLILKGKIGKETDGRFDFSKILIENIPINIVVSWYACNKGSFILLSLLENGNAKTVKTLKKALINVKTQIQQKQFKGAQLLLNKLISA